jgi:hypothetical protein
MNAKQTRKARMTALRAMQFTFGPYAVTCTIRNPITLAIVGYGIGADQAKAVTKALDSIRA